MTSASPAAGVTNQAPPADQPPSWFDDAIERYNNPIAYARKNMTEPKLELQKAKEMTLLAPGGQDVKLEVHLLKERPFWSKVSLSWKFRLVDVEGDEDSNSVVVGLVFDSWTGSVEISENTVLKVDEIQRPITGGAWKTKTDFGELEIKIVPFWTGYQYELWHEGKEVYNFFA